MRSAVVAVVILAGLCSRADADPGATSPGPSPTAAAPTAAAPTAAAPAPPIAPPLTGMFGPTVAVPSGRVFFADTAAMIPDGHYSVSWRLLELQVRHAVHPKVELAVSGLLSPGSHGGPGFYGQVKAAIARTEAFGLAVLAGGGMSPRSSHQTFALGGLLASLCVDGARCWLFVNATVHAIRQNDQTGPWIAGGGAALGAALRFVAEWQHATGRPDNWPYSTPNDAVYLGGRYRGRKVQVDLGVGVFTRDNICVGSDPLCDGPEGLLLPLLAISGAL